MTVMTAWATARGNHIRRIWADELIAEGSDPLRLMIDFGHSAGMELFWSMRMNDTHDSNPSYPVLMSRWKQDHRDLMMAPEQKRFPYGGRRWSAVDYGKEEVREKVFRILRDVATRYDVDGLELVRWMEEGLVDPSNPGGKENPELWRGKALNWAIRSCFEHCLAATRTSRKVAGT